MSLLLGVPAYCVISLLAVALGKLRLGRHLSATARRNWRMVSLIFAALAIWRVTHGEQWVLDHLRAWTRLHDYYEGRRAVQVPVTLGIITIGIVMIPIFALRRLARTRHPLLSELALVESFALVLFSLVKLISLHQVDSLLYRGTGPIRPILLVDLVLAGSIVPLALLEMYRGRRRQTSEFATDLSARRAEPAGAA